jgi:hypothetical protein
MSRSGDGAAAVLASVATRLLLFPKASQPQPPTQRPPPPQVVQSIGDDMPYDCWTIDLRAAAIALGEVSGDEVAEEVLDAVFSRFCLGK